MGHNKFSQPAIGNILTTMTLKGSNVHCIKTIAFYDPVGVEYTPT